MKRQNLIDDRVGNDISYSLVFLLNHLKKQLNVYVIFLIHFRKRHISCDIENFSIVEKLCSYDLSCRLCKRLAMYIYMTRNNIFLELTRRNRPDNENENLYMCSTSNRR